jgi:hypothetical protein
LTPVRHGSVRCSSSTRPRSTPSRAAQQRRQERLHQQQADEAQRIHDQQASDAQRQANRQARLSEARQQQLIAETQQRTTRYAVLLQERQQRAEQLAAELRAQKRINQYQFQQAYLDRLRRQQYEVEQARYYNYDQDPYFYSAPTYRYSYSGPLLRDQPVRRGPPPAVPEQWLSGGLPGRTGGPSGQLARRLPELLRLPGRQLRLHRDVREPGPVQLLLPARLPEGYEDGYYSRSQYGQSVGNGKYQLIAGLLSTLLNLTSLR